PVRALKVAFPRDLRQGRALHHRRPCRQPAVSRTLCAEGGHRCGQGGSAVPERDGDRDAQVQSEAPRGRARDGTPTAASYGGARGGVVVGGGVKESGGGGRRPRGGGKGGGGGGGERRTGGPTPPGRRGRPPKTPIFRAFFPPPRAARRIACSASTRCERRSRP